jgi:hypothetical protein
MMYRAIPALSALTADRSFCSPRERPSVEPGPLKMGGMPNLGVRSPPSISTMPPGVRPKSAFPRTRLPCVFFLARWAGVATGAVGLASVASAAVVAVGTCSTAKGDSTGAPPFGLGSAVPWESVNPWEAKSASREAT